MKSTITWIIVIVVIILIGWWWHSSGQNTANVPETATSTTATTTAEAPMIPATSTLTLNTSSSANLGAYLVATNGMTLYRYTPDTKNKSNCTGTCAANWPPYTVDAGASLTGGANATGTIATITRADGSTQVTYNGIPLYFYIKDKQPGDTLGQNVGGIWFVVKP